VGARTLTLKHMSVAFSRMEEGLHITAIYSCLYIYSQQYTSIYYRVHIVCIALHVIGGGGGRKAEERNLFIS
jgi:hypothetical protein